MKRVFKDRLLKLADYLENQARDETFDLTVIATTYSCALPSPRSCGTAACAIGHMPQVFPRLCEYTEPDEDCAENGEESDLWVEGKGEYEGLSDFDFAESFFGIDNDTSLYLFEPSNYGPRRGRKTVARRIRKFVEKVMPVNEADETESYDFL